MVSKPQAWVAFTNFTTSARASSYILKIRVDIRDTSAYKDIITIMYTGENSKSKYKAHEFHEMATLSY